MLEPVLILDLWYHDGVLVCCVCGKGQGLVNRTEMGGGPLPRQFLDLSKVLKQVLSEVNTLRQRPGPGHSAGLLNPSMPAVLKTDDAPYSL